MTYQQRRTRAARQARQGYLVMTACAAVLFALAGGAAWVDAQQGVTVDSSLRAWGL